MVPKFKNGNFNELGNNANFQPAAQSRCERLYKTHEQPEFRGIRYRSLLNNIPIEQIMDAPDLRYL